MTGTAIGATAAAVGGIGSMIGAVDAGNKAGDSYDKAMASSQAQFDFNQQQLDDWENMFGGLEQNVTDFYTELDPTKYATESKTALFNSMDKSMKQYNEDLSARGMQSAGMKAQADKEMAFAKAEGAAGIDMGAEEHVAGMQSNYLNSKENRRTNATAGVNNAFSNQTNMYSQQGNMYGNSQAGFMGASGNMFGTALGLGLGN